MAPKLAKLVAAVPPEPQLATLVESVPAPQRWRYELKWDGYRLLAYCSGKDVCMLSRRGHNWTGEFVDVVKALAKLRLRDCILDGEVCAVGYDGVPSFNLLQNRAAGVRTIYVAFDLLWQAKDLRRATLEDRQAALTDLVGTDSSATIFASTSTEGDPKRILRLASKAGYEGIIAKEKGSRYSAGRSRSWLKVKCTKRQEFAILGYVPLVNSKIVGALLLGLRDGDRFVYAGRVGTGFTTKDRTQLATALDKHTIDAPLAEGVPRPVMNEGVWVKPTLVAEVAFLEWTSDGIRHPSFKGLRKDKRPEDCVKEMPGADA